MTNRALVKKRKGNRAVLNGLVQDKTLHLMLLPLFVAFIVFHYLPSFGALIAFKDYDLLAGVWNSDWVGLKNFTRAC